MTSYSYDSANSTSYAYDTRPDAIIGGSPVGLLLTITHASTVFTNYSYDTASTTNYSYDNAN